MIIFLEKKIICYQRLSSLVSIRPGDDEAHGGAGDDYIVAQNGSDTLYGDAGADTIFGGGNGDVIYGGADDDVLNGQGGYDDLWGEAGDDVLKGHGQKDNLYGGDGHDTLLGGDDNDTLYGGGGDDTLKGQAGTDHLYAGAGDDLLYGGGGADTFYFEAAWAFNDSNDLQDFSAGDGDMIDVSEILDGAYDPVSDAITDFVAITDDGTHSYLKIDADGGADNFVQIARIAGTTGLTDETALESAGTLIAA